MFRRLMVDVAVSYGTCDSMGTLREIPESADISNLGLLCVPDWKLCRIDDFMYGFEQKLSGRKGISMIEIKDVSLNLNKRQILDHVSLKLQEGKIYGLVGNNGSGKTMLMKCVCGFIHPTSGIVLADGKVIGKDVDYLPDAGVIIETPGFISYYSGLQNLKVLAGIKNKIGNLQIRDAMKRVGLDPDLKLSVKKYSLGMRQRLGLAQAMMESPSVLILDEPMNGLDENGVEEIRQLLLSMKNDHKTIVIASHNTEDIQVLCDEVYEMENGKLCNMNTV